jgi:hypothetical protein
LGDSKYPQGKIIFLDVDGVLTSPRVGIALSSGALLVPDPVVIGFLNLLIADFKPKIVVSSTWRKYHRFRSFQLWVESHGLTQNSFYEDAPYTVVGPDLPCRGDEVAEWLVRNPGHRYLILDDGSDFLEDQKPFLVQTDSREGFLLKDYYSARKILMWEP